jgi:hypothetical protein
MKHEILFILILAPHVSATLGHHQVILLKLSHCTIYNLVLLMCVLIHFLDASSHFVPSKYKFIFIIQFFF